MGNCAATLRDKDDKGNSCLNCKFFFSWYDRYDHDEYEPSDSGMCDKEGEEELYVNDDKICDEFQLEDNA